MVFLIPCWTFAADHPAIALDEHGIIHGGSMGFAGASRDSVFLIGPWEEIRQAWKTGDLQERAKELKTL